eukprot:357105-Chlamydomonas_euryale.AAC.1
MLVHAQDAVDVENPEDAIDILEGDAAGPAGGAEDRPRITTRYMTKYEKARVLGTRALQIRCGERCGERGWEGTLVRCEPGCGLGRRGRAADWVVGF